MTWLYGPLHQAPAVPPPRIASVQEKFGIDEPLSSTAAGRRKAHLSPPSNQATSSIQAKPILKRRSITDILAMAHVPPRNLPSQTSPIYESVSAELEASQENEEGLVMESEPTLPPAAGVLQASSRPPLWHTKSDSIIVRQGMRASLSTSPMSIHGLTPPRDSAVVDLAKSASLSPPEYGRPRNGHRSDSSSSYQVSDDSNAGRVKPKRHISFNSFVEQRIVVDPVTVRLSTVYARSSSDSGSDDDEDEDTILQMRSSSGSSIASGRRGSSSSTTSFSETPTTAKITPHMTMITAPIAPTLLKEPDHLPAPSPAVVFVAPQGIDEDALKYEMHLASRPHFGLQADRKRAGSIEWSPNDGSEYFEQSEMTDYFANVPLAATAALLSDPDREPIYTDEDEDAITVRRRKNGVRSPRASESHESQESSPPTPLKSAFARKSHLGGNSSPPTVSNQEVARSMARYGTNIRAPDGGLRSAPVPRRSGSSSDLVQSSSRWSGGVSITGSAPRSSHLSASMSSMRTGDRDRAGANRARARGASFEGVDMVGHTSALSGRSGSNAASSSGASGAGGKTAVLFSPPREADLAEVRGRSQKIGEDERPRRGRSLLRTGSSSTISERERSSTAGSSSSPLGSLSPRPNSSVGIVGGFIVPPSGTGAPIVIPSANSTRSGSGLRFEAGSWSTEEERIDGGDLSQIDGASTSASSRPSPPSRGLVRTSSSGNIPSQTSLQSSRSSGIRRSNSSTSIATKPLMLQRTGSSSNISGMARQPPQLVTSPVKTVPTLTIQPSSRRTSLSEPIGVDFTTRDDNLASNPVSPASHSLESTGSFWHANELESPATPLSPSNSPAVDDHHELLLAKSSIKPRASGLSLASNGSNSSSTTVMPTPAVNAKRRSAQLSSASSSLSSNASTPPSHRRSGSKSSLSTAAPPTPPSAMLSSSSSSISTRLVTQTVATRSEIGSPSSASEKQLRRLSGGISPGGAGDERSPSSHHSSSPVSPGFVLSNVVGRAQGLFDALWGGGDHSG